jgi:hypothetical protein
MSLLESVKILVAAKPDLSQLFAQLKDTSIPLDERWEAFTLLVNNNLLVNESTYYGHSEIGGLVAESGGEYCLYDDFHIDRGVGKSFPDLYADLLDKIKWKSAMAPTQESLRDWQERVLQNGYSSFINEW